MRGIPVKLPPVLKQLHQYLTYGTGSWIIPECTEAGVPFHSVPTLTKWWTQLPDSEHVDLADEFNQFVNDRLPRVSALPAARPACLTLPQSVKLVSNQEHLRDIQEHWSS